MSQHQSISPHSGEKHAKLLQNLKELTGRASIARQERSLKTSNRFPLSLYQQRLFLLHQVYSDLLAYNMCHVLDIKGSLHDDLLLASLQEIVERQESLRTRFVVQENQPWQEILPACSLDLP